MRGKGLGKPAITADSCQNISDQCLESPKWHPLHACLAKAAQRRCPSHLLTHIYPFIYGLYLPGSSCRGLGCALPAESAPAGYIMNSIQAIHLSTTAADTIDIPHTPETDQPSTSSGSEKLPVGHFDFSRRQMMMVFTCNVCSVRSAKAFSKAAYTQGVVIVECSGCQSRHLVADHLGWFGEEKGTIEQFVNEDVVTRLADGTLELSPEDLLGKTQTQALRDGNSSEGLEKKVETER